jgi:hypothetical protein
VALVRLAYSRQSVADLSPAAVVGGFVLLTVVAMELRPTRIETKYPPPTAEAAVENIDVSQPSMT